MSRFRIQQGFTLVEMILVITIFGFLFSVLSYFYVSLIKNQLYQNTQLDIFEEQLFTREYITRYIKNAFPSTVKVINNSTCVEFHSILGSGLQLSEENADQGLYKAINLSNDVGQQYLNARYVTFFNEENGFSDALYPLISVSKNTMHLGLKAQKQGAFGFVLLSDKQRFCLEQNKLQFYLADNSLSSEPITGEVFSKVPFSLSRLNDEWQQLKVDLNFGTQSASLNSRFSMLLNNE